MKFMLIAATAALAAISIPANAAVQLDQNALVVRTGSQLFQASTSVVSGADGWDLGQTFTAGLTGTLSRVDLQSYALGAATSYTLTLYNGNLTDIGATPVSSVTFSSSQTLASFNAGGVVSADVSSLDFTVAAGSVYSYKLTAAQTGSPSSSRLGFAIGTYDGVDDNGDPINLQLNSYAGGRSYRETFTNGATPGWDTTGNFANDRGFATYVNVTPAPEPGEWAMMGAGLAIVGGFAKRRQKA